jgi:hypothetical protein
VSNRASIRRLYIVQAYRNDRCTAALVAEDC